MALKDFMGYMKTFEDIAGAEKTLAQEDDVDKRNKASDYLFSQGLSTYDPVVIAGLNDDQRKQYAAQGLDVKKLTNLEDIGNNLKGKGLEGIVGEIGTKPFEELAIEAGEQLAKGKVKGYDKVIGLGRAFYGLKDLEKRYDGGKGKVDTEELKVVYGASADLIVEDIKKKVAGKYSKTTVDAILGLTRSAIAAGGIKDKEILNRGIKKMVTDAEKELRSAEAADKKPLASYAIESIKALRNSSDAEESAIARSILYEAGKKYEKAKKEAEEKAKKK